MPLFRAFAHPSYSCLCWALSGHLALGLNVISERSSHKDLLKVSLPVTLECITIFKFLLCSHHSLALFLFCVFVNVLPTRV